MMMHLKETSGIEDSAIEEICPLIEFWGSDETTALESVVNISEQI